MTWLYHYTPATWPMFASDLRLAALAIYGWRQHPTPGALLSAFAPSGWHAALENPHAGKRLVFGDVDVQFAFLAERINPLTGGRGVPETPGCTGTEEERGIL